MNEQKCNEIISRWRTGASIRQIARDLGLARNTVSGVLAQIQTQRTGNGQVALSRRRSRLLDPYEPVIQDLLARYPDLSAVRLWEELRRRGFTGGYTGVRQRLAELRPGSPPAPVIRFETAPGVQAQMDYSVYDIDFTGAGRRRVYAFSYVLGYSRRQYVRFVESQDMATTLCEHVRAFTHLGGVASTCLYDNMKVVVTGHEDGTPIYNPRFLAFATHYGCRPVACLPRRPQTKGKVERQFRYVDSSLLNGRSFETLNHLNETTAWWLTNVADVRELRHAGKTPLQLHQEELAHLVPLPAQPYDVWPVIYRAVNVEGLITYRQNGYSVPWRHIGSVLPVRVTETEVIIYSPQIEEIARHPLLPCTATGQRSVHKEHRPSEDARLRQAQLEERFAALGETGSRFLEGLLRTQRYGKDQAQRVLALLGSYARADLIAALSGPYVTAPIPTQPWNASCRFRPNPRASWRRWPRKSDGTCHPGWTKSRSPPGPRRSTNPSAIRSRPTMSSRPNQQSQPTRPTTPPRGELRQKILEDFQALRVPLRAEQLDAVLAHAESQGMSHLEFLRALINEQANQRRERSIAYRIRDACFVESKTLADFDWLFNAGTIDRVQVEALARAEFIGRKQNLVVVGQSGVGKSHIIQAIGQQACVLGYRVRYTTSALVLADLTASLADQTLPGRLRDYAKFDLVILDEFGFDRIERTESPQAASLLYKLINARTCRSTALVTNIDFEAWGEYLGDPPLAMAFLDRIVDGAIILKINGKSYRAHRAQQASSAKRSSK